MGWKKAEPLFALIEKILILKPYSTAYIGKKFHSLPLVLSDIVLFDLNVSLFLKIFKIVNVLYFINK